MEYLLNLARCRELLLFDQKQFMPEGAIAYRQKMISAVEAAIDDELLHTQVTTPKTSADPYVNSVDERALVFLRQRAANSGPMAQGQRSAYENLLATYSRFNFLTDAGDVNSWLQQTENLHSSEILIPECDKAFGIAKQSLMEQPQMAAWLAEAEASESAPLAQHNIALIKHKWQRDTALTKDFVGRYVAASSVCYNAWVKAKKNNDFDSWLPSFKQLVELTREKAQILGTALGCTPYEALLDEPNPGLTAGMIKRTFGQLEDKLPWMIATVTARQAVEAPPIPLPAIRDNDAILRVARRVSGALGMDPSFFRLDQAPHPFSGGNKDDVRIAIREGRTDILAILTGTIHEDGHGFYTRGQVEEWREQPVGGTGGMWVHETQSLFWERQVMFTPEFMEFLSPILMEELGVDGPQWEPENLYRLVTQVKPGLIRTDADELTYPLHVVLRWKLERALIDGSLEPEDLPRAWNEGMQEMLGVEVPDDTRGCLQDVHYAYGLIGNFPGYYFGAQGAAMLGEKIRNDLPEFKELVRQGNFSPIREWLNVNMHQHGATMPGVELLEKASAMPFTANAWFKQINERYLGQPAQWQDRAEVNTRAARVLG